VINAVLRQKAIYNSRISPSHVTKRFIFSAQWSKYVMYSISYIAEYGSSGELKKNQRKTRMRRNGWSQSVTSLLPLSEGAMTIL